MLTDDRAQASTLNALAQSYMFSGQPVRSVPLFERYVGICLHLKDRKNQQVGLSNLSMALHDTGRLREEATALRHALLLARELKWALAEIMNLLELGRALSTINHQLSHVTLQRALHISLRQSHRQPITVVNAVLAERSLWLRDFCRARAHADQAWESARDGTTERDIICAAFFQGKVALGLDDLARADERLHRALTRARAVNLVELELPALVAIAELVWRRDDLAGAKERLDEVWDAAERGPYPLYVADAYILLAEIKWAEGDRTAAIEAATKAYRAAWCDGPPYAYHWGLEKAKAQLRLFGAPEPKMPAFEESKFEPMPEVEINPRDKYWVDPDALD